MRYMHHLHIWMSRCLLRMFSLFVPNLTFGMSNESVEPGPVIRIFIENIDWFSFCSPPTIAHSLIWQYSVANGTLATPAAVTFHTFNYYDRLNCVLSSSKTMHFHRLFPNEYSCDLWIYVRCEPLTRQVRLSMPLEKMLHFALCKTEHISFFQLWRQRTCACYLL